MATETKTKNLQCMQQVNNGRWCQESYETATGDARRRAAELRKCGFQVTMSSQGIQVTPLGTIKITLVDIRPGKNQDTCYLPTVSRVDWPR